MKTIIINIFFLLLNISCVAQFVGHTKLEFLSVVENTEKYSDVNYLGSYDNGHSYYSFKSLSEVSITSFVYFNPSGICHKQKDTYSSNDRSKIELILAQRCDKIGNIWIERSNDLTLSYTIEEISGIFLLISELLK